ncbi:hypothetical protein LPB72_20010 [Hydrogenophaga crassostreae]|uniref:Glycosyltransferase RgtA/B/C/D-like domain-containing protein n=1 Tax=Hydrogenophaga crassostreae TaxID=1763535 RepID=A0A167GTL8_9BURK|nr:glycosyltransferase family 39 protein [Hydrogenophaga crassostreae]AOW11770.1 hypothetical protein LPB072_01750 [Hydrogenophaga crassostreae]OAD39863.1 hypothetical protein LPB72_20010 [Hydrogenophaga crassostreae]
MRSSEHAEIDKTKILSASRENWLIAGLVLVALGLRVWAGPYFGLPYLYDVDESAFIGPALKIVWNADLNPGWFGHPGSTVIYLNAAAFKIMALIGDHQGLFHTMREFRYYVLNDPTTLYALARSLFVAIGTCTAWFLYSLTKTVHGRGAALLAGAILAVMPIHVEYSQIVRTDILATMLAVLAAHQAISLMDDHSIKRYIASGALIGAAVATKYPAVLIGTFILTAHILIYSLEWRALWRLGVTGATALLALFICSPYLFIDHAAVKRDISAEAAGGHLSATGEGFFSNFAWYLLKPLEDTFGWWGMGLALIGAATLIRHFRAKGTILGVFTLVYLLAISTHPLRWTRWIIPVLPFIALFAAVGAFTAATFLAKRFASTPSRLWLGLLSVALCLPMLLQTIEQARFRSAPDTRLQAREWLLANVPRNSRMLIEAYGPQIPKNHYLLYNNVDTRVVRRPQGLLTNVMPSGHLGEGGTLDALSNAGIEYFVISGFYERFKATPDDEDSARIAANYEKLMEGADLMKEFLPATGRGADPLRANVEGGPHLRIFKIRSPKTPPL